MNTTKRNNMITIEYCKDGTPISDFEMDEFVHDIKRLIENNVTKTLKISNELVIRYIQFEILKNEIDYRNVVLKFGDNIIEIDEDGLIKKLPVNLLNVYVDICTKIINCRIDKKN